MELDVKNTSWIPDYSKYRTVPASVNQKSVWLRFSPKNPPAVLDSRTDISNSNANTADI